MTTPFILGFASAPPLPVLGFWLELVPIFPYIVVQSASLNKQTLCEVLPEPPAALIPNALEALPALCEQLVVAAAAPTTIGYF